MSGELNLAQAIEMLGTGRTEGNVAETLGVTLWGLKLALRDAGYKRSLPKKARVFGRLADGTELSGTSHVEAEVVALYRRGLSRHEVSLLVGRSEKSIGHILATNGIAARNWVEAGKIRRVRFLSGEKTVREMLGSGLTSREVIAQLLGLDSTHQSGRAVVTHRAPSEYRRVKRAKSEDRHSARIVELYDEGRSINGIAKKLRRDWRVVKRVLLNAGRDIQRNGGNVDASRVCELYAAKATIQEIAAELNVSRHLVRRVLVREGVTIRSRERVFVAQSEMTDLYAQGLSMREIAERCGCSLTTVFLRLEKAGVVRRSMGLAVSLGRARKRAEAAGGACHA